MKRLLGQGNENKTDRVTASLPKTARRTTNHEMSLDPAPHQRNTGAATTLQGLRYTAETPPLPHLLHGSAREGHRYTAQRPNSSNPILTPTLGPLVILCLGLAEI